MKIRQNIKRFSYLPTLNLFGILSEIRVFLGLNVNMYCGLSPTSDNAFSEVNLSRVINNDVILQQ